MQAVGGLSYWAVLDGKKLTISGGRPPSMLAANTTPVKVVLKDTKPTYRSVIDKSTSLKAAIPVLSISWDNTRKAAVTVTDAAQFMVTGDPTDADWNSLGASTGTKRWVFIDAALLSIVSTDVLTKKGGTGSALLSALNIGGERWEAQSGTSTSFVVSLTYKQRPCDLMNNYPGTVTSPTGGLASGAVQENQLGDETMMSSENSSTERQSSENAEVFDVIFDSRSPSEIMAAP